MFAGRSPACCWPELGEYQQLRETATPFPYRGHAVTWGEAGPPASRWRWRCWLAACLGKEATADDRWTDTTSWRLHEQFAEDLIRPLDAAVPLALEWDTAQS